MVLYGALIAIGGCVAFYFAAPLAAKVYLRRRFVRRIAFSNSAYLTFDDGPNPAVTPMLLDVLSRYGVHATFFLIGEKAQRHPDLVERLIETGHEIGEHGFCHLSALRYGPLRIARDLWNGAAALDSLGVRSQARLFRPPYGKLNLGSLLYLARTRRQPAFWTIDPQDFMSASGSDVAAFVLKSFKPGDVVLLHDGCGNVEQGSGTPVVISAVERILREAKDRGIRFSTLPPGPLRQMNAAVRMHTIAQDVRLGAGVQVQDFVNLYGCAIGEHTKIGPFVEIQKNARVGKNCKISSHTFICEGVTIEDDVFVGHNVTFINDRFPRATNGDGVLQGEADWQCVPTLIKRGASIGSSATVLCGVTIAEGAIVGAGSVVTRNVPPYTVVAGNPARVLRKLETPSVEAAIDEAARFDAVRARGNRRRVLT